MNTTPHTECVQPSLATEPALELICYHPGNLVDYTWNGEDFGMQITEDMCLMYLSDEIEVSGGDFSYSAHDPGNKPTTVLVWPTAETLTNTQLRTLIAANHATQGNPY
jgi:hypothetical protein